MIHIIILNPVAGSQLFAEDLRKQLNIIKGLEYYIFTTRYAGDEANIVKQVQDIFEDERLRYYVCGGQGTFHRVINAFESLDKVEIAFVPYGRGNDFLKVFGSQVERFADITELIRGDLVDVDYIRTNHGIALNHMALGIEVSTIKLTDTYHIFQYLNKRLPHHLAMIRAILKHKTYDIEIESQSQRYTGKYCHVFLANGFSESGNLYYADGANAQDGKGILVGIEGRSLHETVRKFRCLKRKKFAALQAGSIYEETEVLRVCTKDGAPIPVSLDGVRYENEACWEAVFVRRGLHLLVPKGVKL